MRAPGAVYIVDDSAGVRRSLQWMLGSAGFLVEAYGSARQFLDACHPMIGGCLLLDVRMPGMDGLGLQQELDTLGFTIPVIFITGDGDVEMAARATRAGAFDFLEKPFNASLLLDRVRQAIAQDNQARSDREARSEIARRLSLLTSRERQVLDMVVAGKANKVIASELGISDRTVEKHRAKVMRKCKASSLAELVSMACSSRDSRQLGPPS